MPVTGLLFASPPVKKGAVLLIIKYLFAKEAVSIDVPEEWGTAIQAFDRQEHNNEQTERRRHVSLDGMDFEGEVFADPADVAGKTDDAMVLAKAIRMLEPRQRDLLWKVYFEGYSISEIAQAERVSIPAIRNRLIKITNKLKNNT